MRNCVCILPAVLLAVSAARAETANLLKNGGFDAGVKGDLPVGWTSYAPHGGEKVQLLAAGARDGQHCVSLRTEREVKACLVSEPLPVAPGEKLNLSVWYRTRGLVASPSGRLIFSAGFLDVDHRYFKWHRAQPVPEGEGAWRRLTTEAVVPDGAAYVTFQIGIDHLAGETLWDSAELRATSPVAIRFAARGARLLPGEQELPLVIINRDSALAGKSLMLTTMPGRLQASHALSDKPEQAIIARFRIEKRGKVQLKAALAQPAGKTLAAASAQLTVPPLLMTEPPVPTHHCIEDGSPQLEGRAWVFEEAAKAGGLTLVCTLSDDARTLASWRGDASGADPILFQMRPEGCGRGSYTLRIRLQRGSETLAEAIQDWHVIQRAEASVTLGADGYPRVEGKPFFPLGMYNGGRPAALAAAGFNVTHGYNVIAMPKGEIPNHQRVKDFLDETHKAGMKMLMLVTHGMGHGSRSLGEEVVRRVHMFRNHPGLLAWDEEEGVARGEMPPSFVAQFCAMLRKEGPRHPIMIGDTRDAIQKVDRANLFPHEHMDMGMWWWYPFPLTAKTRPATATEALEGENAGAGLELVPPDFLTHPNTTKPAWVGIQAYRKPRGGGRFPTPVEYRAQAYLAVIAGAKGLMYYVGYGTGGILTDPQAGHWEELKKLVGELREMAPVFMSPDAPEAARVSYAGEGTAAGAPPLSVRLKAPSRGRVLLAVNRSEKPLAVTIATPGLEAGPVRVRCEERSVDASGGSFADKFEPYAVHVYEW